MRLASSDGRTGRNAAARPRPVTPPLDPEIAAITEAVTVETWYAVSCKICGTVAVEDTYLGAHGNASFLRLAHMAEHARKVAQ